MLSKPPSVPQREADAASLRAADRLLPRRGPSNARRQPSAPPPLPQPPPRLSELNSDHPLTTGHRTSHGRGRHRPLLSAERNIAWHRPEVRGVALALQRPPVSLPALRRIPATSLTFPTLCKKHLPVSRREELPKKKKKPKTHKN